MNTALIFIPGIKGTKLYDSNTVDNEILWQDFRFNFEDFTRVEPSNPYNNNFFDEDFTTITRPLHIEPLAYREFWRKTDYRFKFIFPYDWRLPNKENGKRLKEFMQLILDKSQASEDINDEDKITHFDFVTHSMGNMPLRFYILENGMALINKIIFVCPPFKGSPEAITALVVGQGMFFNREDSRKLARTLPALLELLPTFDHYAIDSSDSSVVDLFKSENWQANLLEQPKDEVVDKRTKKKFLKNLERAKNSLKELEDWNTKLTQEEKDRILVLIRADVKTLLDVVVEKNPKTKNPKNYIDLRKSLHTAGGDGTVPNASSCHYCSEFTTYCFENRPFLIDDYQHPFVLKDSRIQRVINGFLNSKENSKTYEVKIIGDTVFKVTSMKYIDVVDEQNQITHRVADLIKE